MSIYKFKGNIISTDIISEIVEDAINYAFQKVQTIMEIKDGGGMFSTDEAEQQIVEAIIENIQHNQRAAEAAEQDRKTELELAKEIQRIMTIGGKQITITISE